MPHYDEPRGSSLASPHKSDAGSASSRSHGPLKATRSSLSTAALVSASAPERPRGTGGHAAAEDLGLGTWSGGPSVSRLASVSMPSGACDPLSLSCGERSTALNPRRSPPTLTAASDETPHVRYSTWIGIEPAARCVHCSGQENEKSSEGSVGQRSRAGGGQRRTAPISQRRRRSCAARTSLKERLRGTALRRGLAPDGRTSRGG